MKALLAALALVACSHPAPHPAAPPVPLENATRSCSEAAAGLDRATRTLRGPDESILGAMHARCLEDSWSGAAIDCFATMKDDDLGRCAGLIEPAHREAMFSVLAGDDSDRASLAVIGARLANLRVGVGECDRFVSAVQTAMTCEGLPAEQRRQLGAETADFWSLPTSGLAPDVVDRMVHACTLSLDSLRQQVAAAGCMP